MDYKWLPEEGIRTIDEVSEGKGTQEQYIKKIHSTLALRTQLFWVVGIIIFYLFLIFYLQHLQHYLSTYINMYLLVGIKDRLLFHFSLCLSLSHSQPAKQFLNHLINKLIIVHTVYVH